MSIGTPADGRIIAVAAVDGLCALGGPGEVAASLMPRGLSGDAKGSCSRSFVCFFFQAEDGIRDLTVTGVHTCALPILVAVPEIGGQPARCRRDGLGGPGAIGEIDGLEWRVAITRHSAGLLLYGRHAFERGIGLHLT